MSGTFATGSLNRSKRPPELAQANKGGCESCGGGGCGNCPLKGKVPMREEIQKAVDAIRERPIEENTGNKSLDKESKSILGLRVFAAPETIFTIPKSIADPRIPIHTVQKTGQISDSRNFQMHEQITRSKSQIEIPATREEISKTVEDPKAAITQVGQTTQNENNSPQMQGQRLATEQDPLKIDFVVPQDPVSRTINFKTKTAIAENPKGIQIPIKEEPKIEETENRIQNHSEPQHEIQTQKPIKNTQKKIKMEEIFANIEQINVPSNDNAQRVVIVQKIGREVDRINEEEIVFIPRKKELPKLKTVNKKEKIKRKIQSPQKKEENVVPTGKIKQEKLEKTLKIEKEVKKTRKLTRAKIAPKESEVKATKKTREDTAIAKEAKTLTVQITKIVSNEKFTKLKLKETKELEERIKKLLAKRAEKKTKKKISIFELLELFKNIKKKKTKSKKAA